MKKRELDMGNHQYSKVIIFTTFGAAIGAVIGATTGNVGLGIGLGYSLGCAVGFTAIKESNPSTGK